MKIACCSSVPPHHHHPPPKRSSLMRPFQLIKKWTVILMIYSSVYYSSCILQTHALQLTPNSVLCALLSGQNVSDCHQEILHMTVVKFINYICFFNFSDYPLQLFSPVIAISNALFNRTIRPRAIEPSKARR